MRKFCFAVLLIAPFTIAGGQNLDQRVEVTNTYVSAAGVLMKEAQPVCVPDSVTRFDYRFDYTSFDTPYKGAYEFRPYLVKLQPLPSAARAGRFYLRADAGYTLHPSLHALWTPVDSSRYSVNVYNDFDGYYGKWRRLDRYMVPDGSSWTGYVFSESVGASTVVRFDKMDFSAKAGYDGIFAESSSPGFHSAAAVLSLKGHEDLLLPWSATLDYRYGCDVMDGGADLHVNSIKASGGFSAQFKRRYFIFVDMLADMECYAGKEGDWRARFAVTPYGMIYYGNWDFRLGFSLGYAFDHVNEPGKYRTFPIFPSCEVVYNIPSASMRLFAGADGGYDSQRYIDFKRWDPHYGSEWGLPECTVRTIDAYGGFQGFVGKHFSYSLRGGYARYDHRPFASAADWYASSLPHIVYSKAAEGYLTLKLNWDSERLDIDGCLDFRKLAEEEKMIAGALAPPMFSGSLSAVYNYRKRIYAGIWFQGETSRSAILDDYTDIRIPGWADLGLMLEYRLTPAWGLRFQAGNLLGQDLRKYSPYYVENGRSFTLGLTLNL